MFEALAVIPAEELSLRHEKCRRLLRELTPQAGGLLVFSRPQVYYLTGTLGMGCVWLPLDGEPLLLLRKGVARAALESPTVRCAAYRSYKDLPGLAAEAGVPFTDVVAVDQSGLSWQLGEMLASRLSAHRFVSGAAFRKPFFAALIRRAPRRPSGCRARGRRRTGTRSRACP